MTIKKHCEQIFFEGEKFFSSLIKDISKATKFIEMETYIYMDDKIGQRVAVSLAAAAKRGVKVRLLVDGCGTSNWGGRITRKLEKSGAETRIYHPFPWRFWHWGRSVIKAPFLLKILYLILRVNRRNHRKVCLIDNQIAYVSSFNVTSCHLRVDKGGKGWRDTGVRVENSDMTELQNAFEGAWDHLTFRERFQRLFQQINTKSPIRLNNSRHRRRVLYKNLLRRIARCKERIWITNAYFVPDNFLLKKLKDAAEKGVDVRIMLPHKSDVLFLPWTSTTFYEQLLKAGVKIFEYLPSMLHAKTIILDDWMMVGSSNLNHRSLLHDLEVDVTLTQDESKWMLEKEFLLDLTQSKEINLENWHTRPFYQRFFGRLMLYVKYMC